MRCLNCGRKVNRENNIGDWYCGDIDGCSSGLEYWEYNSLGYDGITIEYTIKKIRGVCPNGCLLVMRSSKT